MSHRANYVLVESAGWSLHHAHWGAKTLPYDLFWGPEPAEQFIRAQTLVKPTEWLDELECEGAALMDTNRRHLLFYSGVVTPELWMLHCRRVYMALLRTLWKGWTVQWAFDGLGDLVDYLHLSRDLVRSSIEPLPSSVRGLQEDLAQPWSIVSVRSAQGGLSHYSLRHALDHLLLHGPELLTSLMHIASHPVLAPAQFPADGGATVDCRRQRVDFWRVASEQDLLERLQSQWRGWEVHFHGDSFEDQLTRAEGTLRLPMPTERESLEQVIGLLHEGPKFDPIAFLSSYVAREGAECTPPATNPLALKHYQLPLSAETREQMLQQTIATFWAQKQNTR